MLKKYKDRVSSLDCLELARETHAGHLNLTNVTASDILRKPEICKYKGMHSHFLDQLSLFSHGLFESG